MKILTQKYRISNKDSYCMKKRDFHNLFIKLNLFKIIPKRII